MLAAMSHLRRLPPAPCPRALAGGIAALLLVVAAGAAVAAPVDRYRLEQAGLVLELSQPAPGVLRVRAGRHALPEDASWAVDGAVRARHLPLELRAAGTSIELDGAGLRARLDARTLHLAVTDGAGSDVLEDAPGAALSLAAPGEPGPAVRLRKAMPADAHYFGLGDKTGPLDRRGGSFVLWNTDAYAFGPATDPLYKAIPFVLGVRESGGAFGLLVDTTWRSTFDFGRGERDVLAIGAEGGAVDYYVIAAPTPAAVLEAYAGLTGHAPLAPRWSLGFQQSRYSYETDAEVRAVARRLRADRIPADALYLDIDYQDHNRPFTVAAAAFPDLPALARDLAALDLGLVLITDLHVARVPGAGYRPYDDGLARDAFLHTPAGEVAVAEVWPGPAVFPDFSRASVRAWWGSLYRDFVALGAVGFWNDMNEPAVFGVRDKTLPLDTVHRIEEPGFAPRTASHAEMHNVYGQLNSRASFEGLEREAPGRRPFVLTRATYAGGQRYAATWTGDNVSTWEHLGLSTAMLANLGLSGIGYAGADVGGFTGAGPSPELLTRWIEVGAFQPLFRDHAGKGKPPQEPWAGGSTHEAIRRRYIEERYRLLPYLYTVAEAYSRTGVPLLRPVFLDHPGVLAHGDRLGGTEAEFLLGPDLLVAPAPDGDSPFPYSVTLPEAGWYDYWSGRRLDAASVAETPVLERLPVYVRPGAILPRQPLVQSTRQRPRGPLELHVYPGPDCRGALYLDDGVSLDYREGAYLRREIRCAAGERSLEVRLAAREGRYPPWWSAVSLVVHGLKAAPRRVLLDGGAAASVFDRAHGTATVRLPERAEAGVVRLELAAN
jgi:alpha-glucosidase